MRSDQGGNPIPIGEIDVMTKTALAMALTMSLTGSGALAQSSPSKLVLITEQEAKLPAATATDLTFRAGITRGPRVLLVSPASDASVQAPVRLQLKFESYGGAKIDPASVKVTYLKNPSVDLTDRLKTATQAGGIDVGAADVPPGVHNIRVDLKDSDGRAGTANFTLKVAQ
jgi:hypothetical protein